MKVANTNAQYLKAARLYAIFTAITMSTIAADLLLHRCRNGFHSTFVPISTALPYGVAAASSNYRSRRKVSYDTKLGQTKDESCSSTCHSSDVFRFKSSMAGTSTALPILVACLTTLSTSWFCEGWVYAPPKECGWFTDVLRNCSVKLLPMPKYREAVKVVTDENVRSTIHSCMIQSVYFAPDEIFCTENTSMAILHRCFKEGYKVRNRTDEQWPESSLRFFEEIMDCVHEYHYGHPMEYNEYTARPRFPDLKLPWPVPPTFPNTWPVPFR